MAKRIDKAYRERMKQKPTNPVMKNVAKLRKDIRASHLFGKFKEKTEFEAYGKLEKAKKDRNDPTLPGATRKKAHRISNLAYRYSDLMYGTGGTRRSPGDEHGTPGVRYGKARK